jgi:hypothetical protein
MVRYWLLSADDIRRINERRREHNRLGFAVQLCLLRYPGWPLKEGEKPPSNLLEFVAQQIDADPDEYSDYAAREQTRQEHQWILALHAKHQHVVVRISRIATTIRSAARSASANHISRRTSSGFLSSRSPTNLECRRWSICAS